MTPDELERVLQIQADRQRIMNGNDTGLVVVVAVLAILIALCGGGWLW